MDIHVLELSKNTTQLCKNHMNSHIQATPSGTSRGFAPAATGQKPRRSWHARPRRYRGAMGRHGPRDQCFQDLGNLL
jgi:hypothetical protein